MRVGIGYDVHAFSLGRPLIIGGVQIPYHKGLQGHSDADVLIHAVMDALLGACCLGDIGSNFPDNDPAYLGISSILLLKKVGEILRLQGYTLGNLDSIVIAQRPKIAPFIEGMKTVMAEALETEPNRISIKATTTEKLGFEGREEGISAQAVVCIIPV